MYLLMFSHFRVTKFRKRGVVNGVVSVKHRHDLYVYILDLLYIFKALAALVRNA